MKVMLSGKYFVGFISSQVSSFDGGVGHPPELERAELEFRPTSALFKMHIHQWGALCPFILFHNLKSWVHFQNFTYQRYFI